VACEGHRQGITDSCGKAGCRRVGSARWFGNWHEAVSIARPRRLGAVASQRRKRRGTESVESFRAKTIAVGGLLDHLHHIAAIQSRLADVVQLVVLDVGRLVIRLVVLLGHVVVERHVRMPYAFVPVSPPLLVGSLPLGLAKPGRPAKCNRGLRTCPAEFPVI
jgi:hypothetical protein